MEYKKPSLKFIELSRKIRHTYCFTIFVSYFSNPLMKWKIHPRTQIGDWNPNHDWSEVYSASDGMNWIGGAFGNTQAQFADRKLRVESYRSRTLGGTTERTLRSICSLKRSVRKQTVRRVPQVENVSKLVLYEFWGSVTNKAAQMGSLPNVENSVMNEMIRTQLLIS